MTSQNQSYLVLARKYRPQNFEELKGQDVLVQTLQNAIKSDKTHHAYILTGIRGVGKTTTARIIAKTLNCEDEKAKSEARACGKCQNCEAISAFRHQDVIEIDAASKTGIDDMREIIDSISYAPVLAKFKIYIIDEVHMLSNQAFNALLKTLEEPPSHVKFIFATTEINKVPITILSRCQRFNLRRLDEIELVQNLQEILKKEGFEFEDGALSLIAKASGGSVRDSLSITDQALSINNYEKKVEANLVEKMLGVNEKDSVFELLQFLLEGKVKESIAEFNKIYEKSSLNISQILELLTEVNYLATKKKILGEEFDDGISENLSKKLSELADKASNSALAKIWQMLLKGRVEIENAISQKQAFEMLIFRICHLANLPNLGKLINSIGANKDSISSQNEKNVATKNDAGQNSNIEEEIAQEILRNFEGAKIINS